MASADRAPVATVLSARIRAADAAFEPVGRFLSSSRYADQRFDPAVCDFTFGNPHELPLPGLVAAIRKRAQPETTDWFAYKLSEDAPRAFIAESLSRELGLPFSPGDIALTTGAFAAIAVAIHLLLDPGDEAVFSEPGWFCYEPLLLAASAAPRKVRLTPRTFDLDLGAIDAAITPRTRLVIVNSPHNPTGRIYQRELLRELADVLERASTRIGHRIYLLSDEPYRRLRFDGRGFDSPAAVYPWTLVSYSYGKVLLAPGQRLGYLALSPVMPAADRRALSTAMVAAQMALGWCFPNAVMQYAVPDLESLSIDQAALTWRRDRLLEALSASCEVLKPEGTFYLWAKWPTGDPEQLWNALADRHVFVLPGRFMNTPDYFRICLTASNEMVERALPVFSSLRSAGLQPRV